MKLLKKLLNRKEEKKDKPSIQEILARGLKELQKNTDVFFIFFSKSRYLNMIEISLTTIENYSIMFKTEITGIKYFNVDEDGIKQIGEDRNLNRNHNLFKQEFFSKNEILVDSKPVETLITSSLTVIEYNIYDKKEEKVMRRGNIYIVNEIYKDLFQEDDNFRSISDIDNIRLDYIDNDHKLIIGETKKYV